MFLFPFRLLKILMNVLRNPFPVMKTLNASTVTVRTAVLVRRDSLEMDQRVKVC